MDEANVTQESPQARYTRVRLPADESPGLVTLPQQMLSQVRAVLASDPNDQCTLVSAASLLMLRTHVPLPASLSARSMDAVGRFPALW